MGAFLLGPFMIKHIYIIIFIAAIASYYMMRWTTREDQSFQKLFLNTMTNAVFIWFFTFKFSTILFQPAFIMKNPLSLLYFTGGTKGSILGVIIAIIYLFWNIKKREYVAVKWFTSIVYGIVTFFICFWLSRTLFLFFF